MVVTRFKRSRHPNFAHFFIELPFLHVAGEGRVYDEEINVLVPQSLTPVKLYNSAFLHMQRRKSAGQ